MDQLKSMMEFLGQPYYPRKSCFASGS